MPDVAVVTTDTPDPETVITQFEGLVEPLAIDNAQNTRGQLFYSWHYLQLYSYWGLHLPSTEAALKTTLGISNPGAYTFFDLMCETYAEIGKKSQEFLTDVFPAVVSLGDDLAEFAEQATSDTDGGGMFSAIADLLEHSSDDALTLMGGLQKSAKQNADKATELTSKLASYKAGLVGAQSNLEKVKTEIESDAKTSQAQIDKLESLVPGAAGSLAQMKKIVGDAKALYDHDVVVAATSPTYVWVFPFGTIAAVAVATTFGVKAVLQLDEVTKCQAKIDAAQGTLRTAHQSRVVQQLAESGVQSATTHTDLAIVHATTVQNAWNGLATQLNVIMNAIDQMATEKDGVKKLQSKAIIKVYLTQADKAWGRILAPLQQLVAQPYIVMDSKEGTAATLTADVKKALAAKNGS